MATTITNYKVFVGSPSDLADERSAIEEVVDELNQTTGSRNNFRIELVKWETHSGPGADKKGVQSRINKDVGDDYDLFIGLLWTKFGTPTPKFASGTAEEFARAKRRFDKSPKSLQVLVYFKDAAPANLRDIDPGELQKVNEFRKTLGKEGVLYWSFNSVPQLQQFLRLHIPLRIESLDGSQKKKRSTTKPKTAAKSPKPSKANSTSKPQEDDLGTLDYQEIITDALGESTKAIGRVGAATTAVGAGIRERTDEFTKLNKRKKTPSAHDVRSIAQRAAAVMNSYADQLEPESTLFYTNFERGIQATTKLATLLAGPLDPSGKTELLDSMRDMNASMEGGMKSFKEMLSAVENLPRLEKELNRSRRRVEERVSEFIGKLEVAHRLSSELVRQLSSM